MASARLTFAITKAFVFQSVESRQRCLVREKDCHVTNFVTAPFQLHRIAATLAQVVRLLISDKRLLSSSIGT